MVTLRSKTISPEYLEQNRLKHQASECYGASGEKHAAKIQNMASRMGTEDILDYGCGKGTLGDALGFDINEYDPCIPGKDSPPDPADLVVCTDVMEHIEPEYLDAVLDDLKRLTKIAIYLNVAMYPALKHLPDGRNTHLIQENREWWLPKLMQRFELKTFTSNDKIQQDGEVLSEFLVLMAARK